MEFTNEIYFNDKLVENKTAKINYNGRLVREGSNEITMVYGFGSNWDHTQEKAMTEGSSHTKRMGAPLFTFQNATCMNSATQQRITASGT